MKKIGRYPINSRITIDYSGEKPKVKFGYPSKKHQLKESADYLLVVYINLFIILILALAVVYGSIPKHPLNLKLHCNFVFNGTNYPAWIFCFDENSIMRVANKIYVHPMENLKDSKIEIYEHMAWWRIIFFIIVLLQYFFGKYWISFILIRTRLQKYVPRINKWILKKSYSITIRKVPRNKIVELPLFKNIYLDYQADKEFAKYLKKVEIKEHPFIYYAKIRKKKKKGLKNYWLWYARFYFSRIPKSGRLKLEWT